MGILRVWLSVLAVFAAAVAGGTGLFALCRQQAALRESPFGWAPAALLVAGIAFAFFLHPVVGLAVLVAFGIVGAPPLGRPRPADGSTPVASLAVSAGVLLGLVVLAAVTRPLAPLYWDEFVWLGKARLTAGGFHALRDAALAPGSSLVPPGYPLLWPFLVGAFAWTRDAVDALVAGGRMVLVVALGAYLHELVCAARRLGLPLLPWATGAALLGAPLLAVHARSVYVDLPTGLLTAALALACLPAGGPREGLRPEAGAPPLRDGGGPWLAPAAYALVLAGMKDEGFLHAVAVTFGAALLVPPSRRGTVALPVAPAAVLFGAWRVLLEMHDVDDADHALGAAGLADAPELARLWGVHALDVPSFGVFWPVVLAAVLATITAASRRGRAPGASFLGALLVADAAALFGGIVFCPARVHEFARSGTLVGRILVQHAPLGAVVLAAALLEAWGYQERSARTTAVVR
jgi:hypothetical protein